MSACPKCSSDFAVTGTYECYRACPCQVYVKDKGDRWFNVTGITENYYYENAAMDIARTCGSGVFIDVGANRGQWLLPLINQFRRIIAFEPEPDNYFTLLAVTQPHPHIEARQEAVTIAAGNRPIHLTPDTQKHGFYAQGPELQVICVRLADIINEPVDLVKVDAEGSEPEIVLGALPSPFPIRNWLIETHYDVKLDVWRTFLEKFGYSISGIDGNHFHAFEASR